MHTWQMQEAKAKLSEVVKCAEKEGPQEITLHGQSVAIVISRDLYDRLSGTGQSLVEFMRSSPLYENDDVTLIRDQSTTREISS
jgi:prevent-host-death family protein